MPTVPTSRSGAISPADVSLLLLVACQASRPTATDDPVVSTDTPTPTSTTETGDPTSGAPPTEPLPPTGCDGLWWPVDWRCPPDPATTPANTELQLRVTCGLLDFDPEGLDTILFLYAPNLEEENGAFRWDLKNQAGSPSVWPEISAECTQSGSPRMTWIPDGTFTGGPEIALNTFGVGHLASPSQEPDWFGEANPQVPSAACDEAAEFYVPGGWPVSFVLSVESITLPATP